MRTINGVIVKNFATFFEGRFWRWEITDVNGVKFVDGGNFRTENEAQESLVEAFDPTETELDK